MGIEQILSERKQTHGDFSINSEISQRLKSVIIDEGKLTYEQREALDMILHKISRIIAGNANTKDHWDDIAGYATLVSNIIERDEN